MSSDILDYYNTLQNNSKNSITVDQSDSMKREDELYMTGLKLPSLLPSTSIATTPVATPTITSSFNVIDQGMSVSVVSSGHSASNVLLLKKQCYHLPIQIVGPAALTSFSKRQTKPFHESNLSSCSKRRVVKKDCLIHVANTSIADILKSAAGDFKLIMFQFSELPSIIISNPNNQVCRLLSSLHTLPSGHIGQLCIRRSGKTTLNLNTLPESQSLLFNVHNGVDTIPYLEAGAYIKDTEEFITLGPILNKLVVTPMMFHN